MVATLWASIKCVASWYMGVNKCATSWRLCVAAMAHGSIDVGGGRWWKQKRNSRTKMAAPPGRPHQEPPGRPSGGPGGVLEESGGDPVRVSRNILGGIPGIREKHMGVPGAPRGCPGASQSRPGASAGQLRLGVGKVPGQDKTIDRDLIPRCAHADAQFCDSPRCAHAPRRGTRAPKLTTHTQATQPQAPPPHHATDSNRDETGHVHHIPGSQSCPELRS